MYLYYDICTLDSELQNQFSSMLRGGGAMNLIYESALMTTNTVLSPDFTTQVLRNLARVTAMFVTFSQDVQNDENKPGSNQCYLPPSSVTADGTDTDLEFFVTLGGKS